MSHFWAMKFIDENLSVNEHLAAKARTEILLWKSLQKLWDIRYHNVDVTYFLINLTVDTSFSILPLNIEKLELFSIDSDSLLITSVA